ncbi:SAM dependent carboxyl methyltransferase [Phyllobacterium sp. CL33Tsu]|uniref:hypothetical protein n=1 Tax=Phyllobacterium sp. CL33Tsu TaxID=1798191 RepID=UPI0008ED2C20|nr:hypothetical protein [Phyllobacterium sp. CL33Tsu]SFJ10992.1 SAM dependent carboxyl methyltransferase [Phyllobacterium sp. CL33Tsu]
MSDGIIPTRAAMEGGGYYNRHSAMQAAGNAAALALWQLAANSVAFGDEPLVIVDYGSSQGKNSMDPVAIAIQALRARAGEERSIEVIHTDLPSNDFTSLFNALESDPQSYMTGSTGIFPSAIGRSYYEPLFPPGRVHLGWNSWTMQWMSQHPIDIPDHIFALHSKFEDVHKALLLQQARDWRLFLQRRASELRHDGRLLCLFPGRPEDRVGWEWLTSELWHALLSMKHDGLLSENDLLHINIPTAPRKLADIRAPFATGDGAFAGLRIERSEILPGPDLHWDAFERTGDPLPLARGWTGMMRAFSGPTVASSLSAKPNRAALVDELYGRMEASLASNPRRHEHFVAVVLLHKVG